MFFLTLSSPLGLDVLNTQLAPIVTLQGNNVAHSPTLCRTKNTQEQTPNNVHAMEQLWERLNTSAHYKHTRFNITYMQLIICGSA